MRGYYHPGWADPFVLKHIFTPTAFNYQVKNIFYSIQILGEIDQIVKVVFCKIPRIYILNDTISDFGRRPKSTL